MAHRFQRRLDGMVEREQRLLRSAGLRRLRAARALVLALVGAMALAAGACSDPEPTTVKVVMHNETGQNLDNFVLDWGDGQKTYQIFTKDYTFAHAVPVTTEGELTIEYDDADGIRQSVDMDGQIFPSMAGGRLQIYMESDHTARVYFSGSGG